MTSAGQIMKLPKNNHNSSYEIKTLISNQLQITHSHNRH